MRRKKQSANKCESRQTKSELMTPYPVGSDSRRFPNPLRLRPNPTAPLWERPDGLLTQHYIVHTLDKAGRPFTIPEIFQSYNHTTDFHGMDRTYTTKQVTGVIHVHKQYQWTITSTHGLKYTDVGQSTDIQPNYERTQITQEIVHPLPTPTKSVTYDEIEQHILGRCNLTHGAVYYALPGKARQTAVHHPPKPHGHIEPAGR